MRKLILTFFGILLAIYIGTVLFMGSGEDSLKSQATKITETANTKIFEEVK